MIVAIGMFLFFVGGFAGGVACGIVIRDRWGDVGDDTCDPFEFGD